MLKNTFRGIGYITWQIDELVTGGVWCVFDCVLLSTLKVLRAIASANPTKASRIASMLQLPPTISNNIIDILGTRQ
jgi:hypothetical protein